MVSVPQTTPLGGLLNELEQFVAAWRGLPENALWILAARQAAVRRQRGQLQQRVGLAIIGGVAVCAYIAACYIAFRLAGSFEPRVDIQILVFGFIVPAGIIYLFLTLAQLAMQAQQWLAVERVDAKRLESGLYDPLVRLTLIGPSDVLVAALRELLPGVLRCAAVTSCTAAICALAMAMNDGEFGTALLLAPLTVACYFLVSVLGGVVLTLLLFSLGLNSRTAGQRSLPAMLVFLHQMGVFVIAFVPLASVAALGELRGLDALAAVMGNLVLVGAFWLGSQMAIQVPRLGMTWLLSVPFILSLFYGLLLVTSHVGFINSSEPDALRILDGIGLHLLGAWANLSLFHPAAFFTLRSFGKTDMDPDLLQMLYRYPLIVLTQLGLIMILGRGALAAAAQRLRIDN